MSYRDRMIAYDNKVGNLDIAIENWNLGRDPVLCMERDGQGSLMVKNILPTSICPLDGHDGKATLKTAGVKFLGQVETDELFQFVELPQGWKKVATVDAIWTSLVDDKGRKRASIFYKDVSYDRRAELHLSRRYNARFVWDRFENENVGVMEILDEDRVIHTTDPIPDYKESIQMSGVFDSSSIARTLAVAWLDNNHPDWRNPGAYWD